MGAWIRTNAKAVAAALAAVAGSLLLVITGNETFADVTVNEWLVVVLNVLGTFGIAAGRIYVPAIL